MSIPITERKHILKCIDKFITNAAKSERYEKDFKAFVADVNYLLSTVDVESDEFDSRIIRLINNHITISNCVFANELSLKEYLPSKCFEITPLYAEYLTHHPNTLKKINNEILIKALASVYIHGPEFYSLTYTIKRRFDREQQIKFGVDYGSVYGIDFLYMMILGEDNLDIAKYDLLMKKKCGVSSFRNPEEKKLYKIDLSNDEYLVDKLNDPEYVCDLLDQSNAIIHCLNSNTLSKAAVKNKIVGIFKSLEPKNFEKMDLVVISRLHLTFKEAESLIEKSIEYYEYLPYEFKEDYVISSKVVERIKDNESELKKYAPIIENKLVLFELLKEGLISLKSIDKSFYSDKRYIMPLIKKDVDLFPIVADYYTDDLEMARLVLPRRGDYFKLFGYKVYTNIDYIRYAIKANPENIRYAHILNDKDFETVKTLTYEVPEIAKFFPKSYKKKPPVYALLYSINPELVNDIKIDPSEYVSYINALHRIGVKGDIRLATTDPEKTPKGKIVESVEEAYKGTTIINVLKKNYYSKYLEKIPNSPDKENTYDFLKYVLSDKSVINAIYASKKFTMQDIKLIETMVRKYPDEEQKPIFENIKAAVEYNRSKNVYVFNSIVKVKDNKEKLKELLESFGLNDSNIHEFVINNRYYDSSMKSGLLNIIKNYYGEGLRVLDIISILDEMDERDLTIKEILDEKNIKKSDFMRLYKESEENNPILYMYIEDKLKRNKSKGLKKILSLGYMVLRSNVTSVSEYNEKFRLDHVTLLKQLSKTSLYEPLMERFSLMEDFNIEDVIGEEEKTKENVDKR